MKILMTGASGFLGGALHSALLQKGHKVVSLVRRNTLLMGEHTWQPHKGLVSYKAFRDIDVVINLSGAGIADHLWSTSYREELIRSRLDSTKLLIKVLGELYEKPSLFINASAVGIYEPNTEFSHGEDSLRYGDGFLSNLCRSWEDASKPVENMGIRRVLLRTSNVLDTGGGFLKKIYTPFAWGLGAIPGRGNIPFSWISRDDWVRAIIFIIETSEISGPVNLVTPWKGDAQEIYKAFAKALHRPLWFRIPEFLIKRLPGGMGKELMLEGASTSPDKLIQHGFRFGDYEPGAFLGRLIRSN